MKLQRSPHNPILRSDPTHDWEAGAVFNPGATVGEDGQVYLLYRAILAGYTKKPDRNGYDNYISSIGCAVSEDGIHFQRFEQPVIQPTEEWERYGCEDPRITRLEIGGRFLYLITYTAMSAPAFSGLGDRVGLITSEDLRAFHKHGVIIPGHNDKDAVIFPELIQGRITMLHRIAPDIQIVYFDDLDQLENPSESFWSEYTAALDDFTIMRPRYQWEADKIGAGPPPIKTGAGWLLIYHGVDGNHVYRAGAALLDLEDPSIVIARSRQPILEPEEDYELFGDVPNVVFPEGAIVRDGALYLYYGAADKVVALATCPLDELISFLLQEGDRS